MSATPNMPIDAPTGPPLHNPLTAESYAALEKVFERCQILEDSISRAFHIGLNVDEHAAVHERNKAIAHRIYAMYPPPPKHPLVDE